MLNCCIRTTKRWIFLIEKSTKKQNFTEHTTALFEVIKLIWDARRLSKTEVFVKINKLLWKLEVLSGFKNKTSWFS